MTPPGAPRRILMTTDAVGGVWNYALTLCRGLGAKEVEVVLATMGPRPNDGQRTELSTLGNVTLRESDFHLEWMPEPWRDVKRAAGWLLELEQRFAPDLVHLNGFVHGALPWRTPVLMAGHSCVLSWWRAVRGGEPPEQWAHYRKRVRAGIQRADTLVAPSQAMLSSLEMDYGPLRNARVIPNGCDARLFSSGRKEPFVLSVGRLWDEAKNVRALTEIAREIAWPVRVAGDAIGPDGNACALAKVTPLGFCPAPVMAGHYARASIFALPARYEPFGLSILEAALSRCALVLGDIQSLRENWDGAAVFVPPGNRIQLRAAINALIHHEDWRIELAAQARDRAESFTAQRMVDAYLEAYRALHSGGASAAQYEAISA
jgi:glycogen synthase